MKYFFLKINKENFNHLKYSYAETKKGATSK